MLQKNTWAFSIILAMILTTIMLLVAYNLLEMIIPFAKNTKWIENSSNAYYQSYAWVEESINFIAKHPVWSSTWKTMPWTATWYSITMISSWNIIPQAWKWNSEYNKDWNRIAPGEPIQLYVKNWIDWGNTKFYFKIPSLTWSTLTISWWISPLINWQISGSWYTLNASGTTDMINTWSINDSSSSLTSISLWDKYWLDLTWTWTHIFKDVYTAPDKLDNCNNICALKLSIINKLFTDTWNPLPYLEYKIDFWSTSVPQQYVDINTDWKSYWFKKTINTKYRVDTTSEAFDFTVFQ